MANSLRVALFQMKVSHNKSANVSKACNFINTAVKDHKADSVVLPECFNSSYGTQYFKQFAEYDDQESFTINSIKDQLAKTPVTIIAGSIPEKSKTENDKYYNTSYTLNPSLEMIAKHRKIHLFDINIPGKISFQESKTLNPGNSITTFAFPEKDFVKAGVGICYDIRFPELALAMRHKFQTNLLVYPGAFNMTTGPAHWELLARARAVDNQLYVAAVSPSRDMDATYNAWGHSTVVGPWGDVLTTTDENESIIYTDIDVEKAKEIRQNIPIRNQYRADIYQKAHLTKL